MKHALFLALILPILWSSPGAAQYDTVGIIKAVSGKVEIIRDGTVYHASPSVPLMNQDVVTTGKTGFAGLLFKDGTVITLGPESEFKIETYIFEPRDDAYFFNFFMEKGSLVYNSGKIGKLSPKSVRLNTPRATVGIRGTRFIVDLQ